MKTKAKKNKIEAQNTHKQRMSEESYQSNRDGSEAGDTFKEKEKRFAKNYQSKLVKLDQA